MTASPSAPLLTREQAAARLGLAPQTLAGWATKGTVALPLVKLGRSVRYRAADVDALIEAGVKAPADLTA